MEITPYKNGVHSLAEGLRQLNSFLKDGNDPYKMKEVIIKIHHGLETLFKDILFQKNPIFLLDQSTTIKQVLDCYQGFYEEKNNYLFDEARTITPTEAIKRIRNLHLGGGIAPKEFASIADSFEKLNGLRNQLQHFAIKANPEVIIRILGNLIPRSIGLLKMCYAQDIAEKYNTRLYAIPHQPLPGMVKLFYNSTDVDGDLNSIYPEATEIIKSLEARFDILLNEAIQKFKNARFLNQKLLVSIDDHGNIGAPPYIPRIKLEGWMNEKFEPYRNSNIDNFSAFNEPINAVYNATLKIEQPVIKSKPLEGWGDETVSDLKINFEAKMSVINVESFFSIPDASEYIQFVKNPQVLIKINLICEVKGLFNEHHFDIRNINSLSGEMIAEISSSVYGDPLEKPSISGLQSIKLNMNNTSISFHSFVESNGKLKDNYSLKLKIESEEDLNFN